MPSYTTSLRLVQPATGEYSGTWGTQVNTGLTALVDTSIAGTATITMTAANYTLSNANGAADEARAMFLVLGGTPGASFNVICPAVSKLYFVTNNTGYAQTVKTSAGTGISVPNGARTALRCDGTDVVAALNYFGSLTLGAALPAASGGTGLTSPGTANNVLYSNGTTWVAGPLPSSSAVSSFSAGTTGFTPSTATTGAITLAGTLAVANGGTGQTTYTNGQLLIGNTTGNTLTKATLTPGTGISITNGGGSITITNTALGTPTLNVVTGTTQTAVANNHYVLTNVAATTVTLPATPTAGDVVWVTVGNGLTTNVVARNGSNIQSLAEDLTLNAKYASVQMRYINSTIGWTFV
jgi:hypothetical protein